MVATFETSCWMHQHWALCSLALRDARFASRIATRQVALGRYHRDRDLSNHSDIHLHSTFTRLLPDKRKVRTQCGLTLGASGRVHQHYNIRLGVDGSSGAHRPRGKGRCQRESTRIFTHVKSRRWRSPRSIEEVATRQRFDTPTQIQDSANSRRCTYPLSLEDGSLPPPVPRRRKSRSWRAMVSHLAFACCQITPLDLFA